MPLGIFSRSLLAWQFAPCDDEATGSAEISPMLLPFPEVFRDKTSTPKGDVVLKKGVVAVVIVLNFLFCTDHAVLAMHLVGRRG